MRNSSKTHGRHTRQLAIVSLAALAFAACSSDKHLTTGATTPVTTIAPTTTVAESTTTLAPTTTVAETTTTLAPTTTVPVTEPAPTTTAAAPPTTPAPPPPPACTVVSPSATAQSLSTITGDWNGDGTPDSASSWAEDDGSGHRQWFVRADVAGGASSSVALGDIGLASAQVLDHVDLDFALGAAPGMNRDEILANVGENATFAQNLAFFGITPASPCLFEFDNGTPGTPYIISAFGDVGAATALTCEPTADSQFLVHLEAHVLDDGSWQTNDMHILRTGDHSLADDAPITNVLGNSDGALGRYFYSGCGDTVWVNGPIDD